MNPGLPEEAGETARTVVNALKVQPLALALVVINILFVGIVSWIVHESLIRKDDMITMLTKQCIELAIKVPSPSGDQRESGQH